MPSTPRQAVLVLMPHFKGNPPTFFTKYEQSGRIQIKNSFLSPNFDPFNHFSDNLNIPFINFDGGHFEKRQSKGGSILQSWQWLQDILPPWLFHYQLLHKHLRYAQLCIRTLKDSACCLYELQQDFMNLILIIG